MLVAAHAVAAQAVRGTVRGTIHEVGSGLTIGGTVVWLSDSAGTLLARTIADADGRYVLVRLSGSARLHVLHIGFRPVDLAIARGTPDTVVDVQMSPLPIALSAVEATSRRVCPGERGTSEALDLWEQARAALLASVVAREASPPSIRLMSYVRVREPVAHTLISQVVHGRTVVGDRSYVAGRSAYAFENDGYVEEARNGARTFYAPDDNVLLDATFAGTHCMHTVDGTGAHQNEVGIGFDPVLGHGRDTLVEVSGVVWLDRATTTLRSLEFHYVGLEPAAKDAGGELFFSLMPNGAPMIDHWSLHFPELVEDIPLHPSPLRRRKPPRPDRLNMTVHSLREVGGAVASAAWADGTTWQSPYLTPVRGQLRQLDGEPVTGARVWLRDAPDTVMSNSDGYFTIPSVFPGTYAVQAADSVLAGVGYSRVWGEIAAGPATTVATAAPRGAAPPLFFYYSRAEAIKVACFGRDAGKGEGLILGRVADGNGDPVSNAAINAIPGSQQASAKSPRNASLQADADAEGRFAICGVPPAATVRLVTTSDSGPTKTDVDWDGKLATVKVVVP
jgi:hypothetical protein